MKYEINVKPSNTVADIPFGALFKSGDDLYLRLNEELSEQAFCALIFISHDGWYFSSTINLTDKAELVSYTLEVK